MAQVPSFDPPKEISDLKWMVGTWTGSGPFSMMGTSMDLKMTMTCSFEGQFLKSVTVNDFGQIKMDETAYMGWDDEKKEYFSYSFTNMAPTPRIERGKMDGGKFLMVSEPWQGTVGRATMTKVSDSKVKFLLEFKNEDKWEKGCDMEMTKK
jgi:hypothetical protein